MKEQHYALVDSAIMPDILERVEQSEGLAWCLFPAPVDEDMARVAPYLVQLTPELGEHLHQSERPWGFSLTSCADKKALLKHLRALLSVYIEGAETPMFFRYYDPRLLWSILDCLTPAQQVFFAGPIKKLCTFAPEQKEREFESYPPMHQPPKHITLSQEQYSSILARCYQNLEQEVSALFYSHQPQDRKDTIISEAFAKQLVKHLSDWGITIGSDIKSIAHYCTEHQLTEWDQVPSTWISLLSNQQYSAPYRVKALTMNIGGSHEL